MPPAISLDDGRQRAPFAQWHEVAQAMYPLHTHHLHRVYSLPTPSVMKGSADDSTIRGAKIPPLLSQGYRMAVPGGGAGK